MDEQNPKQSGLNVEVPETDLKLSNGSITSDVKLNPGTDNNVDVEQEAFDMDKLSVSNPVKYLATYNSPHEWILDQREAEMAQMIRDTAMPEQASKVGSIAYAAGELKRKTGNMARDFSEYVAGVNAYLFPNSNKEVAQRVYKNMKKLSVQTENNRADYISEHGVDPDVYGPATNIMEVARDMVLTAGVAGAARRSATKAAFGYASSRLAPSAVGVAERFAVQQGKKVASGVAKTAIAGETFMRETGDRATQQVAQYMDATGDYDLKYYDPTVDLALNTGVSAINSAVEMSLGVERAVPDMIFGTRSVGRFAEEFIKGYISERSEEFLQNFFDQGGDLLSGYRDNISLAQAWSDSSSAGWIGGIFRSGAAAGMYYLNRRRMIRQLQEGGIEKDVAAKFVDKVLRDGIDKTLSNMSSTVELRTREGPAYEKMKAGIKNALLMQGWNEKMVDPQTGEVRNIDSYVETFINKDVINKSISEALSSGLSIDDWLDIAQFAAIDNVLYVRPLGTVEDIQKRIDEQDAIIKRQTELKKTGADKPGVLQEARTAKAILQKLKANKLLDGEIERISIEEAKTPEIAKEIDTATTDATELGKANTAADFVGNIEGTDEQKTKRLGNAVMKRIFKDDKRGFEAVMTKPEYANVRAAINSSAAKIFDYIKAHRAYGVAKDLYDALKLLPTVKSGNFISTVNTPDLTGQDPVARNAFLYNFVFNDAHATSAFIDAYLIRAEESINGQTKVRLGKKDLVGQAFKAMDALMQTQADVAGLQYTSIYNEDGSVADPNVAAVVASWQNLFVEVPEQQVVTPVEKYVSTDGANTVKSETLGEGGKPDPNGNLTKITIVPTIDDETVRKIGTKTIYIRRNKDGTYGMWLAKPGKGTQLAYHNDGNGWMSSEEADDLYRKAGQAGYVSYEPYQKLTAEQVREGLLKVGIKENEQLPQRLLEQFDLANENARLDEIYPPYDGDTIEVDGRVRTVYNSEGKRINKSAEALTNFWRWFGDSVIKDKQGRPLVVYHGTKAQFDTFAKIQVAENGWGYYFTTDPTEARSYGEPMSVYLKLNNPVISTGQFNEKVSDSQIDDIVNAFVEKFITTQENKKMALDLAKTLKTYPQTALVDRLDGLLDLAMMSDTELSKDKMELEVRKLTTDITGIDSYMYYMDGHENYVAWQPTQVKSVDNRGTFSSETPNIYWQSDVDNQTIIDIEDVMSDYNVPEVIDLVLNQDNIWGTLIDPVKYKSALEDFVKNGKLLRTKTEDIEKWFEIIVRNTQILSVITDMAGHGYNTPTYEIVDYFFNGDKSAFEKYKKELQARDEELPPEYANADMESTGSEELSDDATAWKLLEDKGFFDKARLPDGSPAWSDFGLQPLWNIISQYKEGMSAEQVLVLINKALDVYHQNGDLASGFIKGGSETATAISNGTGFDELGNRLYSLDFTRPKLVVTHGISAYNLDKALELGGLPAPSLAITRADDPLNEFGAIKLVGTSDMIDPTNPANEVYDRDIWSQTFPKPEYKNANMKQVKAFRDKFKNDFIEAGDETKLGTITYLAANSANPGQVVEMFADSDGAKVAYIKHVLGDDFEVPTTSMYDINNLHWFERDEKFRKDFDKIDFSKPKEEWQPEYKRAIDDLVARGGYRAKYASKIQFPGTTTVDKYELQTQLNLYKLYDTDEYTKWAEKQVEELIGKPRIRVGRKLLEWNAENITNAMIRESTVASEKTFGTPVGKVIASAAKRFESLEDIKEGAKQLKSREAANGITDKAGNSVTYFAENVIDVVGEDFRDEVYAALPKIVTLQNPTPEDIKRTISRAVKHDVEMSDDLLRLGVRMAKDVADVTRSYFEAKPQRTVSFDEFAGAIVPTNPAYDESAQKLADRGLTVVRSDDVAEGMEELSSLREEVLFQGRRAKINGMYDPELGTILIGKNFNGTTLPHEMAHYWLDTIFKVFKQAQAGKLNVRPEWMAQKREMFAMLGINENQTSLTRGQQEKFATMLEAYISGVGVTNEITRTFTDYLKWVPEKYRNLQQLSYVDENGKIQNVFLDAKAVEFFNRWYENPSLPSLSTSPERQRFMNVTGDDGNVIRVSIKEINDREKEFAQDAEERLHTDQRLYNTLDENMPADIKPVADAQKVVISERGNFLKATEEEQKKIITPDDDRKRRWFERKSRETEAQLAQEYIEKNPEHAHEVIFGDPELIPNDTGIDRATLINTYMATNGITEDKPEWAQLHTNIAINQSMAGTQLALSNDKSYRTYLDALREIEEALELKAATNYAGASVGARERFNSDIQQFLSKELPAVFATEAGSKEREIALKQMFEKARTTFSGNTTGRFLTQMDMEYAKAQKRNTDAFVKWAEKVIKTEAGAKLNAEQQAHLLKISAKAQQALTDIDSKDAGVAVAGALELRKWQLEKQKLMGVAPKKFSLFGDYAPRAMLASPNTLLFANIPSTAINTLITNLAKRGDLFGENKVSEKLIKDEIKRIKAIYGSTAMNLAQMEKPTSPTLLHGEKYSASGQKWYDPYTILGREDNLFRVPTFVNTLARIASKDAKATGRSADEVFLEYIKLNDQSDSAKLARKQALAVANMAVFTQNGALARCLNHIRSELNYLSRAPLGLDPHGFGLGSLIAPFLSTGANIAEMGIRGTIAPIVTLTTYAQALRTGKAIDPLRKLALRMDWTYFVFSAVSMALLAALTSDDDEFYIDPYKAGMGYDPDRPYDSINIGGVWVDLDFFGPFAIPMRTAAKVIQAWKKDNGVGTSLGMGYAESAKSVLGDIPLAESIINNQFEWAMKKPGAFASSYAYNQGNKLVPAAIKPISRALSRGQGWMLRPFEGTTVGRKFNRNYGFDGQELTSQDLLEMFTIKFQLGQDAQQYLDNILGLQ